MVAFRELLSGLSFDGNVVAWIAYLSRFILPVFSLLILFRCARSMLRESYEPEIWAYFVLPNNEKTPVLHWESIIGRQRSSDISLLYPTVSRNHAALIRSDDGRWRISDLGSRGGLFVNGRDAAEGCRLFDGDLVRLADVEMTFLALTAEERADFARRRRTPGRVFRPAFAFMMLTAFIALLALCLAISDPENASAIGLAFFALLLIMWLYYLIMRVIRRSGFEAEVLAFFLSALGMSVCASAAPGDLYKQVLLTLAGIIVFIALGWWLRDLSRVKKMRWPAAAVAVGLLGLNLILAQEVFGAKNWISIGGFTFQPSEFVKIAFVYTGAATLDKLFMNKNLFAFVGFSAICVGALALMGDFGTALVFFVTFLVISFMRSGNLATVVLSVSGAVLAGFLALSIKPHIAQRFATWGHVWEYANEAGYQQTRALSAAASGGFIGQGAGRGWLHNIFAADTDLVFALICEELGLIIAVGAVLAIIVLAAFTVKNAAQSRSSFYVIAACASVSLLMAQLALNVFGSLDILPFTGVTFPFVSRGGSSLISCWALLAFIKATDTRRGASFAIRPTERRGKRDNEIADYYDEVAEETRDATYDSEGFYNVEPEDES